MFKTSSAFLKSLACPKIATCRLPHCVFSHKLAAASKRNLSADALSVGSVSASNSENGAKKAKLEIQIEQDLVKWAPKTLSKVSPVTLGQRVVYIKELIKYFTMNKTPTPNRKAVELEYSIAMSSSKYKYGPEMKRVIQLAKKNEPTSPQSKKEKEALQEEQRLKSPAYYETLKSIVHPVEVLEKNQYILSIPRDTSGPSQPDTKSLKTCDRCSNQFSLKEETPSSSKCVFHERKKARTVTASGVVRTWLCCSEEVGVSQGCKTAARHVFKHTSAVDLDNDIPFVATPDPVSSSAPKNVFGIDCEMSYTTKGMECVRVTMIDFFTSKTVFDEILKPSGEILDLNSTWSGVHSIPKDAKTLKEFHEFILNDKFINSETILIGHGLENDLITMRLFHKNVIDSAILYPKGLSMKYSLKDLAFTYLDRKIQASEHSSEEDSLAAMDVVKKYIANLGRSTN